MGEVSTGFIVAASQGEVEERRQRLRQERQAEYNAFLARKGRGAALAPAAHPHQPQPPAVTPRNAPRPLVVRDEAAEAVSEAEAEAAAALMGSPPGLRAEPKHPEPRAYGNANGHVGGNLKDMFVVPTADRLRGEEERKRRYAAELEAQIAERKARDRRERDQRRADASAASAQQYFQQQPPAARRGPLFPPSVAAAPAAVAAAPPQAYLLAQQPAVAAAPPAAQQQPLPSEPIRQLAAVAPPAAPGVASEQALAHARNVELEMRKAAYARDLQAQMREKEARSQAIKEAAKADDERVMREVAELQARVAVGAGVRGADDGPPQVMIPTESPVDAMAPSYAPWQPLPPDPQQVSPTAQQPSAAALAMAHGVALQGAPPPVIRFRSDDPFRYGNDGEAQARQRQQEELQAALRQQVEEKQRRKKEEEERQRQEDSLYEARLEREREALKEQFEREQNKEAERKKEALRALEQQQEKAQEEANRRLGKHRKRHGDHRGGEPSPPRAPREKHRTPHEPDPPSPGGPESSPVAARYEALLPPPNPPTMAPPPADHGIDNLRAELQREQAAIKEQLHRQGRDMARLNERALSAESDADAARKELESLRQQLAAARVGAHGAPPPPVAAADPYSALPEFGRSAQDALEELSHPPRAPQVQFGLAAELDRYDKSENVSYERFEPPTLRKSGADGLLQAASGVSGDLTQSLDAESTLIYLPSVQRAGGPADPLGAGAGGGPEAPPAAKGVIDASQLYARNQRRLEALNELGDVASGAGADAANQLDELLMRFVNAREGSLPPPTPGTEMGDELSAETRWVTPA